VKYALTEIDPMCGIDEVLDKIENLLNCGLVVCNFQGVT